MMLYKGRETAGRAHHGSRADAGREVKLGKDLLRLQLETGDPTTDGPESYNLLLAPAERADLIIDFRGTDPTIANRKYILYSDSPAPFPGGDIRNDYYASGQATDMQAIGGAPATTAGMGPDTRCLMRFVVTGADTGEPDFATLVNDLNAHLGPTFTATQPTPFPLPPTPVPNSTTEVKVLGEDNDQFGRLRQVLGTATPDNFTSYLDRPTEVVHAGDTQVWQIYNTTADTHPMHFHLVNVQVLQRATWAFGSDGNPLNGQLSVLASTERGPDMNEKGWKETVRMNPGEVTTIAMRFDLPPGTQPPNSPRLKASYGIDGAEYVWHCHILEHEEHDMMHSLVITGTEPGQPGKPGKPGQPEPPVKPGKPY